MAVRTRITRHEELRRRLGLGVTELARRVGYSHAYVSQVEGCTITPSARYRAAVATEFDVPAAIIFDDERAARN